MYTQLITRALLGLSLCLSAWSAAVGQTSPPFTTKFFESEYWLDGKAEYNIYDASEKRYGILRETEIRHIIVREDFAPDEFVKADNWQQPGAYPVLKLNRIIRVPTGSYRYDQTWSGFWRADAGQLVKWSLASMDSCGNTYKQAIRPKADDEGTTEFNYDAFTYWQGMARVKQQVEAEPDALWYDELPLKLRALDFSKAIGQQYKVALAPPQVSSRHVEPKFAPATIAVTQEKESLVVGVVHQAGTDTLRFRAEFPHVLEAWTRYDESDLTLRKTLRIPYWELNRPGDEKVLE